MRSRQLELLLDLLKQKQATHRELAEKFGVSVKTIQRDVDRLSGLGVPLHCRQGRDGGIFIDPSYKLSRSFLTKQDLQTSAFALSLYDQLSQRDQKTAILSKLALIDPDFIGLLDHDASEYFTADLTDAPVSVEGPLFEAVNRCLDDECRILLTACGTTRPVAPIGYVLRRDGLHLYGESDGLRLVPLQEVTQFCQTDEEFKRNFPPYLEVKDKVLPFSF
ncbi:hypothetical protein NCCP2716_26540 [Sporosarcina sp. NCCP-2716]|uniref:helix-turn-helix transcriptional regulator n=1 Tax=Sporosarcina sp. NCCP-2716 TaxID=2943679 RepID=UPI00203A8912|nr:HTH domain-containing protein [Sporosarcina sp. NCCP-2716]GKV70156.1 hypothetical protein NCCP2716_26540 [Sporosarcina sp. NCCP-2716]